MSKKQSFNQALLKLWWLFLCIYIIYISPWTPKISLLSAWCHRLLTLFLNLSNLHETFGCFIYLLHDFRICVFKELSMFLVLMHLIKTLKVELRSLRSKKRVTVVLISDLLYSAGKNHEISQQEKQYCCHETIFFPWWETECFLHAWEMEEETPA